MKKIISLLSVVAMLFTLMTTVAFAEGEEGRFYWEQTNKDATSVTLALVFETARNCSKIQASYDTQTALAGGVTISEVSRHANASVVQIADASASATKQVISVTLTDTDISLTGKVVMAEIKFDFANATIDSFTLPQKKAASVNGESTTDKVTFVNDAAGYTVSKPVEEVKTTLGNAVAGKDMYGQKTIAAGISFATGSESKATVTLMNGEKEVESKEYSLPGSGVAGGTTNLVGIIRYNPENVTAGNAFKLTVGEASTTAAIN